MASLGNRVHSYGAVVRTRMDKSTVTDINPAVGDCPATLHRKIKPVTGLKSILYWQSNTSLVTAVPREVDTNLSKYVFMEHRGT